jgi:hypothetical protein
MEEYDRADLLRRLRDAERRWMRGGRWGGLIFGLILLGSHLFVLNEIHSFVEEVSAEVPSELRLEMMAVFFAGLFGAFAAGQLFLGVLVLANTWAGWNGRLNRLGVIAALETQSVGVDP